MAPSGLQQSTAKGSFVGFMFFFFVCLFVPGLQGNNFSYCFQWQCKQDDCRRQAECHREEAAAFLLSIKSKEKRMQRKHLLKQTVTIRNNTVSVCGGGGGGG